MKKNNDGHKYPHELRVDYELEKPRDIYH